MVFRDEITNEILRTEQHTNLITTGGFHEIFLSNGWLSDTNPAGDVGFEDMFVMDFPMVKAARTYHRLFNSTGAARIFESSQVQNWTWFDGPPTFIERIARFNAPTSTRSFNIICNADNIKGAGTIAVLDTPCEQNPGEVLDITYRIQLFAQATTSTQSPVADSYESAVARKLANNRNDGFPFFGWLNFNAIDPNAEIDFGLPTASFIADYDDDRVNLVYDFYKVEHRHDMTTTEYNGRIIRSIQYAGPISTDHFDSTEGHRATLYTPWLASDSPHKPVQTIHNHNADAVEWGLDVDFLATSQGSLSVDGTNWVQEDYPEFYRVDHTSTGAVGTSRYAFRSRKFLGFNGNGYEAPDSRTLLQSKSQGRDFPERTTFKDIHGARETSKLEEYNADCLIAWDNTGITLYLINNTNAITFDENSAQPLPATSIRQVATDTFGNIWVACSNTGLYRIENPLDSTVNITHVSTDRCHAVSVGYDDSVWIITPTSLSVTNNANDPTPTFTDYDETTTPAITQSGVTDDNWNHVRYIRIDRTSPTNEMLIVYNNTIGSQIDNSFWWSTDGVSFTGRSDSARPWGRSNVTRRSAMWLWSHVGESISVTSDIMDFGNASPIATQIFVQGGQHGIFYDYYNVPHLITPGASTYGFVANPTRRETTRNVSGVSSIGNGRDSAWFATQSEGASGMIIADRHHGTNIFNALPVVMAQASNVAAAHGPIDALNGKHTALEEMAWTKYHWNGTAWEKNYFTPAMDTGTIGTGPYNAIRHNFDTESHTFTGRSMIDMSSAFEANNASTMLTVAASVTPTAKDRRTFTSNTRPQEAERTIFCIFDGTTQYQLMWDDAVQGSIVLYENNVKNTIAATPDNGVTSRIVATFDGTTFKVYINGSQVGSDVTLTTPLDVSNANGDVKVYLGSRVFWTLSAQRRVPYPGEFYRGEMSNVQLWNTEWSSTDVSNDFNDITDVITSQPATALIARYQLTQNLEGTETKATHTVSEPLTPMLDISFTDGAAGDSFVATDYHTFGVVDGMLKDNAISLSQRNSLYYKPTDFDFGVFENATSSNTVSSATVQVTEPVRFANLSSSASIDTQFNNRSGNSTAGLQAYPGEIALNTTQGDSGHNTNATTTVGAMSIQPITDDGYIQFTPNTMAVDVIVGFSPQGWDDPNHAATNGKFAHTIHINSSNVVQIWEGSFQNVVVANAHTHALGDTYRIIRTGTAVKYEVEDASGTITTLHDSTLISCLLYTSPSPRDGLLSRMPSSA